jgi:hypothetical protein
MNSHAQAPAMNTEPPDAWQGSYDGVNYSAQSYDWETVTIEFGIDNRLPNPIEVNARAQRPALEHSGLSADIEALLDLGVDYIDIGFNTDRIAAEVPFTHISVDQAFAAKVLRHLVNIRNALGAE